MIVIHIKSLTFSDTQKGTKEGVIEEIDIDDARLDDIVDPDQREQLMEEIELLDGASVDFDQELVDKGESVTCILWFCADKLWCGDISGSIS